MNFIYAVYTLEILYLVVTFASVVLLVGTFRAAKKVLVQKKRLDSLNDNLREAITASNLDNFNEQVVAKAEIRAAAEASMHTIMAMHRHLNLPAPMLVCLPSLREEPISRNTKDLWPYLDEKAALTLDTLAEYSQSITRSPSVQNLLDELDAAFQQPDEQMQMPSTALGLNALQRVEGLKHDSPS